MAESRKVEDDQGTAIATAPANLPPGPLSFGPNLFPTRSSFTHTPLYCEENVYLLCKKLSMLGLADPNALDLFITFISNDNKKIPLWHQKASKSSEGIVIWDYHVICVQKKADENLVWDLDSSLPFPLRFEKYVSETFRPQIPLRATIYRRLLRVIHGPLFLRHFASDRTHMRDPHGNWISPPPSYEPIIAHDGSENNIDEYIQMRAADVMNGIDALEDALHCNKYGVLIDEAMLHDFFAHHNNIFAILPSPLRWL